MTKVEAFFSVDNNTLIKENCSSKLCKIKPINIILDLYSGCNFNCINCIHPKDIKEKKSHLPFEIVKNILRYAGENKVPVRTGDGEPTLYEDFEKFLKLARKEEIPLYIITNGSMLNGKVGDWLIDYHKYAKQKEDLLIRVSLNADENNFKAYTKGKFSFKEILNGIERLAVNKLTIDISITFFGQCSTCNNLEQIKNIVTEAAKVGVRNIVISPGRDPKTQGKLYTSREEKDLIKILNNLKKTKTKIFYIDRFNAPKICNSNCNHCYSALRIAVIGSDGNLYICPNHRYGGKNSIIGKIDKKFSDAWHNEHRVDNTVKFNILEYCENIFCDRGDINIEVQRLKSQFERSDPVTIPIYPGGVKCRRFL